MMINIGISLCYYYRECSLCKITLMLIDVRAIIAYNGRDEKGKDKSRCCRG